MKIYNKKGFLSGIVFLLICVAGLISMFLKGWSLEMGILLPVLFLISITQIKRSCSKDESKEDLILATDEREKFIALQTSHKVLQIVKIIICLALLSCSVIYAVTKVEFFMSCVIVSSVYFILIFFIEIIVTVYYEKHH